MKDLHSSVSETIARSALGQGSPIGAYEQGAADVIDSESPAGMKHKLWSELIAKRTENQKQYEDVSVELAQIERCKLLFEVVIEMADKKYPLEIQMNKIDVSARTQLIEATRAGSVINMSDYKSDRPPSDGMGWFNEPECFFIGRDLSGLIKDKLDDAEWLLPYADCFFEFSLTHKRDSLLILCFATQAMKVTEFVFFARARRNRKEVWGASHWHDSAGNVKLPLGDDSGFTDFPFSRFCIEQIRAACVLMDAEVIEKEQIRADARLNEIRESAGKLPLYDYHVLKLRQSVRYNGVELMSNTERRSPRLHLRRGHWRRVGSYKTWVRWCVVGNEELGMVDKSYSFG